MKLLKDGFQLCLWNAAASIPNFYSQFPVAASAAKQDLAFAGVLKGVCQQISDNLFEQTRIAAYKQSAGNDTPIQTPSLSVETELAFQPLQNLADRKMHDLGMYRPALELIDIEDGIQQT